MRKNILILDFFKLLLNPYVVMYHQHFMLDVIKFQQIIISLNKTSVG
jgi:hypothetical protein